MVRHTPPDENKIRAALADWGLLHPDDAALECWQLWREHGTLPYSGGWLDQPEWVRADFRILNLLETFHTLQANKADTPAANPFQMFGKKR